MNLQQITPVVAGGGREQGLRGRQLTSKTEAVGAAFVRGRQFAWGSGSAPVS